MLYIPTVQGYTTCDKNPQGYVSPAEFQIPFENVTFDSPDGLKIHAWWIPASSSEQDCPTILFCHGNAGNIGFRLPNYVKLREAFDEKLNIFAFDYRGYGSSQAQGTPNEAGLTLDSIGAAQWLAAIAAKGKINKSKIYIFGRSLGGAVAVSLAHTLMNVDQASYFKPKGIILENTFMSISSVVGYIFPWIPTFLKDKLLRLRWETEKKIPEIDVPILLLSGLQDEIIPASQMTELRDCCRTKPMFVTFPDGTHNDTWVKGGSSYLQAWRDFVK